MLTQRLFRWLSRFARTRFVQYVAPFNIEPLKKLDVHVNDTTISFEIYRDRRHCHHFSLYVTYLVHATLDYDLITNETVHNNHLIIVEFPLAFLFSTRVMVNGLIEIYLDRIIELIQNEHDRMHCADAQAPSH